MYTNSFTITKFDNIYFIFKNCILFQIKTDTTHINDWINKSNNSKGDKSRKNTAQHILRSQSVYLRSQNNNLNFTLKVNPWSPKLLYLTLKNYKYQSLDKKFSHESIFEQFYLTNLMLFRKCCQKTCNLEI